MASCSTTINSHLFIGVECGESLNYFSSCGVAKITLECLEWEISFTVLLINYFVPSSSVIYGTRHAGTLIFEYSSGCNTILNTLLSEINRLMSLLFFNGRLHPNELFNVLSARADRPMCVPLIPLSVSNFHPYRAPFSGLSYATWETDWRRKESSVRVSNWGFFFFFFCSQKKPGHTNWQTRHRRRTVDGFKPKCSSRKPAWIILRLFTSLAPFWLWWRKVAASLWSQFLRSKFLFLAFSSFSSSTWAVGWCWNDVESVSKNNINAKMRSSCKFWRSFYDLQLHFLSPCLRCWPEHLFSVKATRICRFLHHLVFQWKIYWSTGGASGCVWFAQK